MSPCLRDESSQERKGQADIRVYLSLDGKPVDLTTVTDASVTLKPLGEGVPRSIRLVPIGAVPKGVSAFQEGPKVGSHNGEMKNVGGYEVEFVCNLTGGSKPAQAARFEAYLHGTVIDFELKPGDRWIADVSFAIGGDRREAYGFQIPFAGGIRVLLADVERLLVVIGAAVDSDDLAAVQENANRLIRLLEMRPAETDKPDFERVKGELVSACRDLASAAAEGDRELVRWSLGRCRAKLAELRAFAG